MRTTQNPLLLKAFAAEVKGRRGVLQISQDELAYRSGVSRTFLGKIEIAQNQPSLTALFKLADGLEVGIEELMKGVKVRLRKEERAVMRATKPV